MKKILSLLTTSILIISCLIGYKQEANAAEYKSFKEVSVHDPSIMEANGQYYIIGSHMNAAKSSDLMNWTSISNSIDQNALFKNSRKELAEALAWGQSDTFWAGDWIKLKDCLLYTSRCV